MLSIGWSIKAHTDTPISSVPLVMQENSTVLRNAQAVILQPNATGTCLVSWKYSWLHSMVVIGSDLVCVTH